MERLWAEILEQFGQDVTLRKGEEDCSLKALVQPVLDRSVDQEVPSSLGLGCQDRLRYMGPAGYPLDLDTLVVWKDREYRVRSAHLAGEGVCPYWWAMLYPRDEVVL